MTSILRRLVWAAQPVVVGLALWLALGGPSRDVRAPLNFSSGGLVTLAQARLTLDEGSWWTTPALRTPAGRDSLLLPQNARIDLVLLHVASLLSHRIPAVVTMAWALMLMCGAASCAWCLRRLGVSVTGAWSAGVLFALCPFALGHNTSWFGLMPYLVPFAATAALQLAAGRHAAPGWRGLLAGNVAVGLNAVYFAVFSALFVGIGAVAGLVRGRRRVDAAAGATILGAIVLATAVNLAPNYLAPRSDWTEGVHLSPAESELQGLKIRRLVSPPPGHWFEPFRRWAARDAQARFADGGETPGSRLGLIGAVGFLGLLAILLVPTAAGTGDAGETVRGASRLTLAAIVLGTVGGLGTVFSLLVSPIIRDYTFITPFLAFFSLAALAFGIDRATRGARPWLRGAVWAGLLIIGVADQSVALKPLNDARPAIADEFRALRQFAGALEGVVPQGSMVFQLPLLPPPGHGRLERMGAYDHFKLFVASHRLRWSYPPVSAEQIRIQREAAAVDPRDLPSYLRRQGFSVIVVDRFGYHDDGTAVLAALQVVPSAARPVALDTRYVALDIREP